MRSQLRPLVAAECCSDSRVGLITKGRKGQSYISTCRIVLQNRTWTFPFPESGGICEVIQLNLQELAADPTRAHFRAHCCYNRRCFSFSESRTNCGIVFIFSGGDSAAHWVQIVDFPVLFFGIFPISVEVEKFPRTSSSSAG